MNDKTLEKAEDNDEKGLDAYSYIPGSATSFQELDSLMAMEEEAEHVEALARAFRGIVTNIMYDDGITDKGAAVVNLANEFSERIAAGNEGKEKTGFIQKVIDKISGNLDKETWAKSYVNDLPDSSFLFIESGGEKDSEGKTKPRSLRHLPYKDKNGKVDMPHLRNALSRLGQDKTGQSWSGFNRSSVRSKAEKILSSNKETSFMLVKSESGKWTWFARYSNKYRDEDNPPEIISEKSHIGFVEKVRNGLAPYPELWLWHVPGTTWGKATWIGYDTSGFALAAGDVYPEYNEVAEALSRQDGIALSHGMPVSTIVRDTDDPSIIVEHETREISPLPRNVAANKMTGFVLFEENAMSKELKQKGISDEDRAKLDLMGIGEDVISAMEEANMAEAKEADVAGIESKEVAKSDQPSEPEAEPEAAPEIAEEPEASAEEPEEQTEEPVAIGDSEEDDEEKDELSEAVKSIIEAVTTLNDKVDSLAKEVREELDQVKSAQVVSQKAIEETPLAARASLLKSIVGDPTTLVDGRTRLGKDKPEEEQDADGVFFFQREEFLNGGQ